jgi:hypothetical protein
MNRVRQLQEPPEGAGKGRAAVTATIELGRDRRGWLRWWTLAVLLVSCCGRVRGQGWSANQ